MTALTEYPDGAMPLDVSTLPSLEHAASTRARKRGTAPGLM